ncbi:merozoite surface protein 2 [Plasmodium sp. DRC-Itaito]|nr:merozoite surface protein 2 [Plasmodium sp. DRC-Itaito]
MKVIKTLSIINLFIFVSLNISNESKYSNKLINNAYNMSIRRSMTDSNSTTTTGTGATGGENTNTSDAGNSNNNNTSATTTTTNNAAAPTSNSSENPTSDNAANNTENNRAVQEPNNSNAQPTQVADPKSPTPQPEQTEKGETQKLPSSPDNKPTEKHGNIQGSRHNHSHNPSKDQKECNNTNATNCGTETTLLSNSSNMASINKFVALISATFVLAFAIFI